MKRDVDLIRALLLYLEEKSDETLWEKPLLDGHSEFEVMYQLILMHEAGFIRSERSATESGRSIKVYPTGLTWKGHEFLDAAREDSVWNRAKAAVLEKTGSLSFTLLSSYLISAGKTKLGL